MSAVQLLREKGPDAVPSVERCLYPVGGAVRVEERVTGAVVAVELDVLARGAKSRLDLVDLCRRRELVVVAEQPEHRAADLRRAADQRDHRRELRRRLPRDEAAVADDRGIEGYVDRR